MMAQQKQSNNKQFSFEKDYPNLRKTRKRPRKGKKNEFSRHDAQETSSSLVSFRMIPKALLSQQLSFKFHTLDESSKKSRNPT